MLHVVAYAGSIINAVLTDVPAVIDEIATIVNNHFQLWDDMYLFGGYFAATNATRARLNSPTFRQISQPFIYPVELATGPTSNPAYQSFLDRPMKVPKGEEISMEALQSSAGAQQVTGVLFLGKDLVNVPSGDIITARFTATTTHTANLWSNIPYTLDQSLPNGTYALVGSRVESTSAIAHRWIIPGLFSRPGALSSRLVQNVQTDDFRNRRMGELGRFLNVALPILQVFSNIADTSDVGYMELIKVA